jgi:hypothetical protein
MFHNVTHTDARTRVHTHTKVVAFNDVNIPLYKISFLRLAILKKIDEIHVKCKKCKLVPKHATKAYEGSGSMAPFFLKLGTRGR